MFKNGNQKILGFVMKILKKFRPRFSFHYVAYTTLFTIAIFSIVQLVSATTPNPGHPWIELGDGVFTFTSGQTVTNYTYTFPAANTTVLTTDALVTVAQGGIGVGTLASNGVLYGNGTGAVQALAVNAGATQCLTQASSGAPAWGACGTSTPAWDDITVPTADLTLAHGAWKTAFSFDSVTTGNAFALSSSSLTSGTLFDLTVTGTAAASNTQKALNISTSGANATSGQSTYGGYFSNTHTGTGSENYGIYATAGGGDETVVGVYGTHTGSFGIGVLGESVDDIGVKGVSISNIGVVATTTSGSGLSAGAYGSGYAIYAESSRSGATTNNLKTTYSASSGTFDTTAGNLSSYGGYFSTTTTRSVGANALTNIGLYATASGAQNNYAAIFESGNIGIGDTSPAALLTVGSGDLFQVNSSGNILGVFANATTDTDRFLVSDSGTIKYRTGAELLSDIGAQASGNYITALTGDVTATGPGSVAATIANDVIDWADIIDSMTVDAATDINLGANALSIDLDSTGDFSIRDVTTDIATFADSGAITFTPTSGQSLTNTLAGTGTFTVNSGVTTGATTASALALNANSLTTGTGLYATSSSLTSGSLIDLQINGTAGIDNQKALNIQLAGANATSTQTTYGAYIVNGHSGTGSTNNGLYVQAVNGANNTGGTFDSTFSVASSLSSSAGAKGTLSLAGNNAYTSTGYSGGLVGTVALTSGADYSYTSNHLVAGVLATAYLDGAGTTADSIASARIQSRIYNTAAVTDLNSIFIESPDTSGSGTVTTAYGIRIGAQEVSGVTTGWGVYQAGASDSNYFAGTVGIGSTTLTSMFNVGTAAQFQVNSSGAIVAVAGLSGATGTYDLGAATSFEIPNSATPTVDADGEIAFDTTVTDFSTGLFRVFGNEEQALISLPVAEFTTPSNGDVITYNSTTDEFELVAGGGGASWNGITDPTADQNLTFNAGEETNWTVEATTATNFAISSSTLTSGTLLSLVTTGTGAATGQTGLNINLSGANGTASQTSYGLAVSNTHTGTTPENYGALITATGAGQNYGISVNASGSATTLGNTAGLFTNGGAGTSFDPVAIFDNSEATGYTQVALQGTGRTWTLGVGNASEAGAGVADDFFIYDYTGTSIPFVIDTTGKVGIGDTSPASLFTVGNGDLFQVSSTGGAVTITGVGDGTDALTLTAGDILLSNGDFDLSGGDWNITLDGTDDALITKTATGTAAEEGLEIVFNSVTGTNVDQRALVIDVASANHDASTDLVIGLDVEALASADAQGTETGIRVGTGWDLGIDVGTTGIIGFGNTNHGIQRAGSGKGANDITVFTTSGELVLATDGITGRQFAITNSAGDIDISGAITVGSGNEVITLSTGKIDADAITLASSGTTGSTSSRSGLQTSSNGLTMLMGCTDGQLLEWTDATGWACANDDGGGISDLDYGDITVSSSGTVWDIDLLAAVATGASATTSSGSGLESLAGGLTLIQGCANGEILKWDETNGEWDCAADTSGGTPSWDTIANPAGSQALTFDAGEETNWTKTATAAATEEGLQMSFTAGAGNGSDVYSLIKLIATSANHSASTDKLYGLNIDSLGSADAEGDEVAINVGQGWDAGLRFQDADSSHYVGFKAPSAVTTSATWSLPTADSAGCFKSDGSGNMSISSCGDAKSEVFTANGTYTMPSDAQMVIVDVIGGGGSGAGGGRNAAGTAHTGGGGGGGGAWATRTFAANAISSPVTVTVPAGTAGGAGSTVNGTNGTTGAPGANVTFGSLLTGFGGGGGGPGRALNAAPATGGGGGGGAANGGANGTTTGGAGGAGPGITSASTAKDGFSGGGGGTAASVGGSSAYGGGGGGGSNNNAAATGSNGGTSYRGGGGGGGGGGANAGNIGRAGGAGGKSPGTANSGGGGGGGAVNTAGNAGADAMANVTTGANGGGGGGGGNGTTGAGGIGGNGGVPGGGGGGGGAGTAANAGNGGAGGRGQIQVWTIRGAGAADLAESYSTNEIELNVADVVSIDPTLQAGVKRSTIPYDKSALGVISTQPNMVMGGDIPPEGVKQVNLALAGRVPVRVSTMNGEIHPGDYLTSSSIPGMAMKATRAGPTIGRSLGTFVGGDGMVTGIVLMYVNTGYYSGDSLIDVASVPGLEPDIGSPIDFSKKLLGKLVSDLEGQDVSLDAPPLNVSDLYIDRLAAAIEIITPKVTTNKLSVDRITTSTGSDINLILDSNGKFIIGGETITSTTNEDGIEITTTLSNPVITFDSLGNAIFAGTVTAKEIKVGDVSGIQAITDQINILSEGQVAFTLTAEVMNTLSSALTLAQADILKLQTDLATTSDALAGLTTSGADIDSRLRLIEAFVTKDESGSPTGIATIALSVSGDSSFTGQAQFDGLSFFTNTTSFAGGVTFAGSAEFTLPPLYNKDSAGYALIKQGDRRAEVVFEESYIATPVVNTSVTFEEDDGIDDEQAQNLFIEDVRFIVVNKNQNGFTILLNKSAPRDIRFSWSALSVRDPSVFESIFEGLTIDPTPDPEMTPEPDPTPTPSPDVIPEEVTPDPDPSPDPEVTPEPDPTPSPDVIPEEVTLDPDPSPEEAPQPEGGVI